MKLSESSLTLEQVQSAVDAIIEALGDAQTPVQAKALTNFLDGDYQKVKRIAATNLSDYFCKSLGYLGGALKLTPNTDTILAESARAAADHTREKTLRSLGTKIEQALNELI